MIWMVWCPEDGETVTAAKRYPASCAEDAASDYVEEVYENGDHFEKMTVHVQQARTTSDEDDPVSPPYPIYEVTVHVDFSPDFMPEAAKVVT